MKYLKILMSDLCYKNNYKLYNYKFWNSFLENFTKKANKIIKKLVELSKILLLFHFFVNREWRKAKLKERES